MEFSIGEKVVILELATKVFSSEATYNYEHPVRLIDIYNEMISALSGETPLEKTQAERIQMLGSRIEELEAEKTLISEANSYKGLANRRRYGNIGCYEHQ